MVAINNMTQDNYDDYLEFSIEPLTERAINIAQSIDDKLIQEMIYSLVEAYTDEKLKCADIKLELSDTKMILADYKEKNLDLQKEVKKLKSPQWNLIFDLSDAVYYSADDTKKINPYCPNCWDNKKEKYVMPDKKCNNCGYTSNRLPPNRPLANLGF